MPPPCLPHTSLVSVTKWKCLKCKFRSQVNVVNQEFVSFMSPPSVNLSPDKFDLLGQPRSRQPKRKGNTAGLLVTRFIRT